MTKHGWVFFVSAFSICSMTLTAVARADEKAGEDKLIDEAQSAYIEGDYQTAIDKAKQARSSPKAARIIAASACALGDVAVATEEYKAMSKAQERQFVQYVCERNGIDIRTGKAATPRAAASRAPVKKGAAGAAAAAVDEKLLAAAQQDYIEGRYQAAIDGATKADPAGANQRALRIIGASRCALKDEGGARAVWSKLDAPNRQFLAYRCQREGITLK